MKQYNATVLAKWQVVIPKDLRDELWIHVGDDLNCFVRWSALVLKKKIQTVSYSSTDSGEQIPWWVESNGKTLSLALDEMKGITCLVWKTWFWKSVHALNMMINMYMAGKSIIVFDPYGDLIAEIKNHIADLGDTSMFHYILGEANDWSSLKKKILHHKWQKVIAINANFQGIWAKESAQLLQPIILDCYKELANDETAVFIDEFSNYFNEKILSSMVSSNVYTCILDQSWDTFSRDQVKTIFAVLSHIAIYQIGWLTAKYLVDDLGLSQTVQNLRNVEKYHFYFHSFVWNTSAGKLLLSIYPLG